MRRWGEDTSPRNFGGELPCLFKGNLGGNFPGDFRGEPRGEVPC